MVNNIKSSLPIITIMPATSYLQLFVWKRIIKGVLFTLSTQYDIYTVQHTYLQWTWTGHYGQLDHYRDDMKFH